MIQMRHVGIYVHDLNKVSEFYSKVFNMRSVCQNLSQTDDIIHELLEEYGGGKIIKTTKLITEYGELIGNDDMLELIEIDDSKDVAIPTIENQYIWHTGCMHIAFGVPELNDVVEKVRAAGGQVCTSIRSSGGGNRWCFCRDPEGNWIELIERKA